MQLCFVLKVGTKQFQEISSSGNDASTFYINNTDARRYQLLFLLLEMESKGKNERVGLFALHLFITVSLLRNENGEYWSGIWIFKQRLFQTYLELIYCIHIFLVSIADIVERKRYWVKLYLIIKRLKLRANY